MCEWLFTPPPRFQDFTELNAWLARRCQALAGCKIPRQTRRTIADCFAEEQLLLNPVTAEFDGYVDIGENARCPAACRTVSRMGIAGIYRCGTRPIAQAGQRRPCLCKTGKTHLATALAVSAIHHGKHIRFDNAVDLVNQLEKKNQLGKAGNLASPSLTSIFKTSLISIN